MEKGATPNMESGTKEKMRGLIFLKKIKVLIFKKILQKNKKKKSQAQVHISAAVLISDLQTF